MANNLKNQIIILPPDTEDWNNDTYQSASVVGETWKAYVHRYESPAYKPVVLPSCSEDWEEEDWNHEAQSSYRPSRSSTTASSASSDDEEFPVCTPPPLIGKVPRSPGTRGLRHIPVYDRKINRYHYVHEDIVLLDNNHRYDRHLGKYRARSAWIKTAAEYQAYIGHL